MLSKKQEDELVLLLNKINPGYYPLKLFHSISRLWTTTAIELVPFFIENGVLKVVLIQRQKSDMFFPGFWHNPGCVIRPTDTIDTTFKRILESELGYSGKSDPIFVKNILHKSVRGNSLGILYWTLLNEPCKKGKLFSTDRLPKNFLSLQQKFIDCAIEDYKSRL